MRATVIQIAKGYGVGHPPQRVAEVLLVFENGVVATRGTAIGPSGARVARTIVFVSEADAILAIRSLEGARPAPLHFVATWSKRVKDDGEVPCLACYSLHDEDKIPERCRKQPARSRARPKTTLSPLEVSS